MLRSIVTVHARVRALVPAVLLYGLVAVPMFVWPGLVSRVADRCDGLAALDVRGYWTAGDARELVRACGTTGRAAYVHLQLLDLVYPAFSGGALLLTTALLLRRYGGRGWGLLVPAIVMTALDYAENAAVWTLLLRWPEIDAAVPAIGGPVSALKRLAAFAAFTIPILLALTAAVQRGRSLHRRSRSGRRGGGSDPGTAPTAMVNTQ